MVDKLQFAIRLDEILALPEDTRIDIIKGEIVEMAPAGFMHVIVAGNVYDILRGYTRQHKVGFVAMDNLMYLLDTVDDRIETARTPDVSFIRQKNIPDFDFSKPFPGAPDLAIEVVSPSESAIDIESKIQDFFQAKTEQIWVIYPKSKKVYQYLSANKVTIHSEEDTFTADTLFPDLIISVHDLFILPTD